MKRVTQSLVIFTFLFCCLSVIVYSNHIRKEIYTSKSHKAGNIIINQGKDIENTTIYNEFLKNYSCPNKKCYYAFIELVGYEYPILLLSDGTYKFTNEHEVAMCTDIYYPVDNIVTLFGNICSDGTAYPIAADETGIYTAGGHEASKYNLNLHTQQINLMRKYIMFFHKIGEKVNSISIAILENESKVISEDEFDKGYQKYIDAKTIYFKHLNN